MHSRQFKRATIQRGYSPELAPVPIFGIPANINRHTGEPHKHEREIARRLKGS